ncbi:MAG TPA: TolC family protein [Chthoniobacteraceae bacterium]|nr:TolC family protein [Chthoniobacteraceae bacterium]
MRPLFFALLFFAWLPAVLEGSTLTLSLAGSAGYTREHNPHLAAARLRIAEARGRLLGAGRLPNPEAGLEFRSDRYGREGNLGVSLDQRFPVTSRLRLEKSLSRQLVAAAELEVREQERLVIAEVQGLFVRLLALDQQRALRDQQVQLARKLASFVGDRAGKGEISPLDAAQAEVDRQRLLLEVRKLDAERITLLGELKPKLGVAATTRLSVSGTLPPPVPPGAGSWKERPDYQLARTREAAAVMQVDLARAGRWDDLSAGAFWEMERSEEERGLERTGFLGMRVSLPLPLWNQNQGEIAEKRAAAVRASLETRALAVDIAGQVAAARAEMEVHARLATETRTQLLPLVAEQTDQLEKAYASGQSDLLTLLRARDQKLQLEAAALEATRDFHLARIRYEAATARHAPAAREK